VAGPTATRGHGAPRSATAKWGKKWGRRSAGNGVWRGRISRRPSGARAGCLPAFHSSADRGNSLTILVGHRQYVVCAPVTCSCTSRSPSGRVRPRDSRRPGSQDYSIADSLRRCRRVCSSCRSPSPNFNGDELAIAAICRKPDRPCGAASHGVGGRGAEGVAKNGVISRAPGVRHISVDFRERATGSSLGPKAGSCRRTIESLEGDPRPLSTAAAARVCVPRRARPNASTSTDRRRRRGPLFGRRPGPPSRRPPRPPSRRQRRPTLRRHRCPS